MRMARIRHIAKWVWRAWPIITVAGIGVVHYALRSLFYEHAVFVNKAVSSVLTLTGGLLVLYSIDENIGMFTDHGLPTLVWDWVKSFPLTRRSASVNIVLESATAKGSVGTLTVKKLCTSVEERVEELERQMDKCRTLINEKERLINQRLKTVQTEVNSSLTTHGADLQKLSAMVKQTVVGGFKSQALGVLFVIYGAILGLFV